MSFWVSQVATADSLTLLDHPACQQQIDHLKFRLRTRPS
jgi:hypothetical protein